MLEFTSVKINKPDEVNLILGQSHFIKTIEDLYEVLVGAMPMPFLTVVVTARVGHNPKAILKTGFS